MGQNPAACGPAWAGYEAGQRACETSDGDSGWTASDSGDARRPRRGKGGEKGAGRIGDSPRVRTEARRGVGWRDGGGIGGGAAHGGVDGRDENTDGELDLGSPSSIPSGKRCREVRRSGGWSWIRAGRAQTAAMRRASGAAMVNS